MACKHVKFPGGDAILCSRGGRTRRCSVCGERAGHLCDYPLRGRAEGKACDAPLCDRHAYRQGVHASGPYEGDSIDYCLVHHELTGRQQKLEFG
jgi:hypothetical protein